MGFADMGFAFVARARIIWSAGRAAADGECWMRMRGLVQGAILALATAVVLHGGARAEVAYTTIPTQYIAALGPTSATSGNDAETWGLWAVDPGPRGVWIDDYATLVANGGVAPDGWQFDAGGWWLEEHGLMMEAPTFPLPPGQYVVTGARAVTSVLTVGAPDAEGHQAWSLADGATLYDVTHLRCRAAVYTPRDGQMCSPEATPTHVFPMEPDRAMPAVEGCSKRDYQVLIVVGMMVDS
jgi:hypothetical protein